MPQVNLTINDSNTGDTITLGPDANHTTVQKLPFTLSGLAGDSVFVKASDDDFGDEQFRFDSWSDGGARAHSFNLPFKDELLFATYHTFDQVSVTPADSFTTITLTPPPPSDNFYQSGTALTLQASCSSGHFFGHYSGGVTGSNPVVQVNVSQPLAASATCNGGLAFTSNVPAGEGATGAVGSQTYNLPASVRLPAGTSQPVSVPTQFTSTTNSTVRYAFQKWSDGVTQPSRTILVGSSPTTYTAQYGTQQQAVIGANIPGLAVTIDNVATTTPASFVWTPFSVHTVAFAPVIYSASNSRYVFLNWMDSGDAATRSITAASTGTVYTANFGTQYFLAVTVNPADAGSVSGPGWYDSGANGSVKAAPLAGFQLASYSGDFNSTQDPLNLQMGKPISLVANLAPAGVPRLYPQQGGPASDSGAVHNLPIALVNAGPGGAIGAQIDSISGITVTTGSGQVTAGAGPISFPDIASGATATANVPFAWPATATRVRMTVNFSANGGAYKGSTVLNLFR
jgi:hypothetical protein